MQIKVFRSGGFVGKPMVKDVDTTTMSERWQQFLDKTGFMDIPEGGELKNHIDQNDNMSRNCSTYWVEANNRTMTYNASVTSDDDPKFNEVAVFVNDVFKA